MAENYNRLGQHVNAVESWRKAIAVPNTPPRPDLHMRLIEQLVQTNPKPPAFEPDVNAYNAKFPTRPDRLAGQVRLAGVYLNDKNPARAEQILASVLPFDARSHSASSAYVSLFGGEADKAAKDARIAVADRTLRDAIAKNPSPYHVAALRYSLAFELLRDRAQNVPAAKAVARELAFQFPYNDGTTGGALNWLLDSPTDEAEFNADVARAVEARRKFPWITTYRGTLAAWAQGRATNKELANRAKAVQTALNAVWGVMAHLGGGSSPENPGPGDLYDQWGPMKLPE